MSTQSFTQYYAHIQLPVEREARFVALRQQARRWKAHLNMSAVKIHDEFSTVFDGELPSSRTISNWISDVLYVGKRQGLEWSVLHAGTQKSQFLRFLVNLDVLSSAIHVESGLTIDEARWAESLAGVFNDPDGLELDLLPQLAIIEEYARRDADPPLPTDDLDIILATRPWEDGGALYKLAIESGRAPTPILPMLVVDGPQPGDEVRYPNQLIGAVAHLGLPWIAMYRSEGRKGELRYVPAQPEHVDGVETRSRQEWKSECSWKQIVADIWKESAHVSQ